jgi:hypothetical protein
MSLRVTIGTALTVAWLSGVLPLIAGDKYFGGAIDVSLALSVVWIVMAVHAIRRYKKPGWWSMLGLPALFWPYWTVAIVYECAVHHSCL